MLKIITITKKFAALVKGAFGEKTYKKKRRKMDLPAQTALIKRYFVNVGL